ncbi:hypothetical protein FDP22_15005 [Paroceanicella profunda]|uniref:Uncharacterized protein n=1 Tax=Paroceanicella profunda TaxID=2579971 RepID=A0A5B8FI92_9RHOB|nr:hypothetical protein FDP22_15005 [Paroceanicella profunda]
MRRPPCPGARRSSACWHDRGACARDAAGPRGAAQGGRSGPPGASGAGGPAGPGERAPARCRPRGALRQAARRRGHRRSTNPRRGRAVGAPPAPRHPGRMDRRAAAV